jgi:hypothetical protein
MLARWLNTVWKWKCAGEAAAWRGACGRVAETQTELLHSVLSANRDSVFGRSHQFDKIRTIRDFQQRVPISTYDDYDASIARIAAGEPNVLTREPVLLLEPTSGTTSGQKLVPYTKSLRRQFQHGIAAWIADLFHHRPAACRGRAYWSISPSLGPQRRTAGGIPIGFDDDAAYLGRFEQWAMRHVLAVPAEVAQLPDVASVRYATLLFLLAAGDLSLISVWSPTFLTSLLASLRSWGERLVSDLRKGRPSLSGKHAALGQRLRPCRRRADEIASLLRSTADDAELYRSLWPKLALVSCWTDAAAGHFAESLARLLPHAEIQPKGLIATEGFVSLPLVDRDGAALAIRSHFFEFLESGDRAQPRAAHEVEPGGCYRVVLTTGGGLYRYDLGDEVQVTGFVGQCPLLRFQGRSNRTSDLVGEKLSDAHVAAVLDKVFQHLRLQPAFQLVAPVLGTPPHYCLFVQGIEELAARQVATELETRLKENPYYRHALQFQQLAPLEVAVIDPHVCGWSLYEEQCLQRGQRAGNIKPAALDCGTDWPRVFEPAVLKPAQGLSHAR